MTMTATDELAGSLDELIREVPGVATLYRSSSLLANAVDAAVAALRPSAADDPLVVVTEDDDTLAVTVTIGADGGSAGDTCRAVYDAISAYLHGKGRASSVIRVTVALVAE